ncbi:MAG: hypothetical protein PVG14_15655 [Anaerolineales bacterium]|jgi:hypothetical protein
MVKKKDPEKEAPEKGAENAPLPTQQSSLDEVLVVTITTDMNTGHLRMTTSHQGLKYLPTIQNTFNRLQMQINAVISQHLTQQEGENQEGVSTPKQEEN